MDDFDNGLDGTVKAAESPESDDVQLTMEDNGDDQGTVALTLDANGHYQFRADTGQGSVTYRVLQVAPSDDGQPSLVTGLSSSQAIIQNLLNGSSSSEESTQPRFAYIPAALSSGLDAGQVLDTRNTTGTTLSSQSGQVYLMMASPDVLHANQRSLIARTNVPGKSDTQARLSRDERRRSTHNEVERRRRDKINQWIMQLGKLIPDCAIEQSKQGDSKSGILSKACDFITDMQTKNRQLEEMVRNYEQDRTDAEMLRQQYAHLKHENEILRAHLQQQGFEVTETQEPSL